MILRFTKSKKITVISITVLLTVLGLSWIFFKPASIESRLSKLELKLDTKIGVYALNTANNKAISYRANVHFPVQSTFKVIAVAALLKQSEQKQGLLSKEILIKREDLLSWAPICKKHLGQTMTLEQLAEAAIRYSDNTATNIIINELGGLKAITEFAQSISNHSFKLSHYEEKLNSNPAAEIDSSTPKDMAISLKKLLTEEILSSENRSKLFLWLKNNTTGDNKIRAGVPANWLVADKTGSGSYGVNNDLGMVWSKNHKAIILSIYTNKKEKAAIKDDKVIELVTKEALGYLI